MQVTVKWRFWFSWLEREPCVLFNKLPVDWDAVGSWVTFWEGLLRLYFNSDSAPSKGRVSPCALTLQGDTSVFREVFQLITVFTFLPGSSSIRTKLELQGETLQFFISQPRREFFILRINLCVRWWIMIKSTNLKMWNWEEGTLVI